MIPFLLHIAFLLALILFVAFKAVCSIQHYQLINMIFIITAVLVLMGSIHNSAYTWSSLYYRYKHRVTNRNKEKLSLLKLKLTRQRPIAIFVPAWHEGDVIHQMAKNILDKADYTSYTLFVGTYPNDLETQRSVDLLSESYANVVKVITKKPGPTSKSDCLNNIYEQMLEYETLHNIHYDTIILHDAEDVVHPYEFLLANYFLLTADAVQIPILPLPTSLLQVVHWIYADEFAAFQLRDSFVRENSKGFVPFAGVGMCLTRRALIKYQTAFKTTPFPSSSLTEDYLLANRMQHLNLKVRFLKVTLQDEYLKSKRKKIFSMRSHFICNWAYFPMNFKRSIRQKTRWMTGIVFQSWKELGWKGSLAVKENLLKDRRLVFDQIANLGTLFIFGYFICLYLSETYLLPFKVVNIQDQNIYISLLFLMSFIMMAKDMLEKFIIVGSVYGPLQGLLAIPRTFFANIINGLAAFNAIKTYRTLRKGNEVKWDKTAHLEGVGSLPSDQQPPAHAPSKETCLDNLSAVQFLAADYHTQLETVSYWNLDHLNGIRLTPQFFELTDDTSNIKQILISLLLKDITNIERRHHVIWQLLQSNDPVIINNCLEYLYESQELISALPENSMSADMYQALLRNRVPITSPASDSDKEAG